MAVVQKRGEKYRVLIRKKGHPPISKTFPTQALAERWAKETEAEMDTGKLTVDKTGVGDTIHEYIRRMGQIGKPVPKGKKLCLERIADDFEGKQLDQLTAPALIDWASGMEVKPSTRQQYIIYFRTALTGAKTLWKARPRLDEFEEAAAFMRMHGITSESDLRDRRVTDEEIEAVAAAYPAKMPLRDLLRFQVASCFRLGETCRLRWDDINEADKTVLIRQRKHPKKKRDEWAPLLDEAWEIVQRQPRNGPLIFPLRGDTVSAAVNKAAERAGVEDLHTHDLRHEGISRRFEQGYDITEVQLMSGHKDIKMLQRYTHLRPADLHAGPAAVRRLREEQALEAANGHRLRLVVSNAA